MRENGEFEGVAELTVKRVQRRFLHAQYLLDRLLDRPYAFFELKDQRWRLEIKSSERNFEPSKHGSSTR